GKLVRLGQQQTQLPHLRRRQRLPECRHASHTDAVGNLPVSYACGVIGDHLIFFPQLRRDGKHAFGGERGLPAGHAVTETAILFVKPGARGQVGFVGWDRSIFLWGLFSDVRAPRHSRHVLFKWHWLGGGGNRGVTQTEIAVNRASRNQQPENESEQEFFHGVSPRGEIVQRTQQRKV